MRFADLSIRNKLLASAGILFLVSVAGVSLSGSMVMSSSVEVAAEREAEALLEGYASDVASDIGGAITTAKAAAVSVEGLIAGGMRDRDRLGDMMIRMVEENPGLVGMTLAFEPNGLDGKDADFTGHEYSDATGVASFPISTMTPRATWLSRSWS